MFYLKRIKELEAKVADLKKMTHEMSHIVQTQSEVMVTYLFLLFQKRKRV